MDDRSLTMKRTGQYNRDEAELTVSFLKRCIHADLGEKSRCS